MQTGLPGQRVEETPWLLCQEIFLPGLAFHKKSSSSAYLVTELLSTPKNLCLSLFICKLADLDNWTKPKSCLYSAACIFAAKLAALSHYPVYQMWILESSCYCTLFSSDLFSIIFPTAILIIHIWKIALCSSILTLAGIFSTVTQRSSHADL